MKNSQKRQTISKIMMNLAPLAGLLLLAIMFFILGTVKDYNIAYGMKAVVNQSVVVAIVATGATFIYTLGSFDISLGASVAVSALLGGMAYNATGSILCMLLVNVGVAVLISLLNSVLASIFNLPVFVTTIAMLSVLNAVVLVLIRINGTGDKIAVPADAVRSLDTTWFKVLVLILFFVISLFVFEFTKIGRMQKMLGSNPVCARLTGISGKKMAIVAFVMAGIGVGLGAFTSTIYSPTLTRNTASSVGMDVIIAIVFGGMPVSGGARSRITAAIIGAFSMSFLGQIMTLLQFDSGIGQMVKACIFIIVVVAATLNQRTRMLPR
ncbi:MAG: inner-membrane translocator [Lachnospiraceae bacterium]|nr:inner-membrane translocator [Lachnospiraceae bacterium]